MIAKFIGKNGSMGFTTGKVYDLKVSVEGKYIVVRDKNSRCYCPYGSEEKLYENWKKIDSSQDDFSSNRFSVKITGGSNGPCPYEHSNIKVDSCDECPGADGESKPCYLIDTWHARTMIGYHIKLFLMKLLHDYVEVEVED